MGYLLNYFEGGLIFATAIPLLPIELGSRSALRYGASYAWILGQVSRRQHCAPLQHDRTNIEDHGTVFCSCASRLLLLAVPRFKHVTAARL